MKDENQGFEDLEEKLAKLIPNGPEASYMRALGRHLDSLEEERRERVIVRNVVWTRFAPLAAAACVAVGVTLFVQNREGTFEAGTIADASDLTGEELDLTSIVPIEDLGDFKVPGPALLPQFRTESGAMVQVSESAVKNVSAPSANSWTVDVKSADEWEREHELVEGTHFIIPTEADVLVPSF